MNVGAKVLGELPLVGGVSEASDHGVPYMLVNDGNKEWKSTMQNIAKDVWEALHWFRVSLLRLMFSPAYQADPCGVIATNTMYRNL